MSGRISSKNKPTKASGQHAQQVVDVSIIVVAWNVKDLLYNCLQSVYGQTEGISFEVIYVDNASEDGSVEMVKQRFPQVKIIQNNENRGFIIASNQGIEMARGRYVLLLNSDTIVLDNAIAKTVWFADAHPEAAVVGCKVLNPDGTLQRTCHMYNSILNSFLSATYLYKIFPKSRFFGREEMTWWDYNDVREVEVIGGCYSLVRKEAIEQVGLMDDIYFFYGDDVDWCYRFKQSGWKVLFTPDPKIIHYGGQNTKLMEGAFMLQLSGAILMFMRKRSRLTFPLARLLTALFLFLRVPYCFAVGALRKDKRKKSIQKAKTYLRGGCYCLIDWKKLLMNKETVKGKL
jgi:GT2 family glycosyltransferase